jgi:hypothetical protein
VDRAPHYLRVVQALALVSGFGPVGIVAGVTVVDCSAYDGAAGPVQCPEADPNCNLCGLCVDAATVEDGSADAATSSGDADVSIDAVVYDGTVLGIGPAPTGDSGPK